MTENMMNNEMNLEELEQVAGGGKLGNKLREAAAPWGAAGLLAAGTGLEPVAGGCAIIWGGLNFISLFC